MPESNVNEALEQLKIELDKIQTDPEKQEALNQINEHVQRMLDEPQAADHQGLRERLDAAIVQFEVEHPALSRAMEMTINSLSSIGI